MCTRRSSLPAHDHKFSGFLATVSIDIPGRTKTLLADDLNQGAQISVLLVTIQQISPRALVLDGEALQVLRKLIEAARGLAQEEPTRFGIRDGG